LVQFTSEVKRISAISSTSAVTAVPSVEAAAATYEHESDAGVQALCAVRLKPLPVRRHITRTLVLQTPHDAAAADDSAVPPREHVQLSTTGCISLPTSSERAVGRGAARYRASLRATLDAHNALLGRMDKTVQAMGATARTKKLAAMMQQEEMVAHTSTIHPSHPFRCIWSCVLVVVVLYYNLAVPLRIMARYDCGGPGYTARQCLSTWDWSLVSDYLCDAVLVADFVLRARYFAFRRYEGDQCVVESDPAAIWRQFSATRLCGLLVLVVFPVDLLAPLTGYLLCLRVTKVASIALLSGVVQDLQQWLDLERGVSLSAEAVTVAHLSVYTALVTVWMAVGWCILHYGGAQSGNWISALYWTLTSITTTGYGDISPDNTPQTVYNVCASIVGPTIFATIIAKFSSYVKK
jgi:hypothetical protein